METARRFGEDEILELEDKWGRIITDVIRRKAEINCLTKAKDMLVSEPCNCAEHKVYRHEMGSLLGTLNTIIEIRKGQEGVIPDYAVNPSEFAKKFKDFGNKPMLYEVFEEVHTSAPPVVTKNPPLPFGNGSEIYQEYFPGIMPTRELSAQQIREGFQEKTKSDMMRQYKDLGRPKNAPAITHTRKDPHVVTIDESLLTQTGEPFPDACLTLMSLAIVTGIHIQMGAQNTPLLVDSLKTSNDRGSCLNPLSSPATINAFLHNSITPDLVATDVELNAMKEMRQLLISGDVAMKVTYGKNGGYTESWSEGMARKICDLTKFLTIVKLPDDYPSGKCYVIPTAAKNGLLTDAMKIYPVPEYMGNLYDVKNLLKLIEPSMVGIMFSSEMEGRYIATISSSEDISDAFKGKGRTMEEALCMALVGYVNQDMDMVIRE